jgi:dipeptidyl aminopeptidase/acylaminoacyl peptidase
MHVRWALWAVSALALGGIAVADPAPQPAPAAKASPPLDAYGRLPSLEQAAISPDGKYLAYVATTNDARRVIVQRLGDGGTLVAGLNVSKTKLRGLQWADNTHLLITTSTTAEVMGLENPAQEWYLLQSFDVVTRKQTPLMEHADSSMNVVVDDPVVRVIGGKTVVFAQGEHFSGRTGTIGLYRVDPVSGVTTVIKPGSDDTVDWFVDNAGEAAAEARYNEPSGRWTLLVRLANGHWTQSKVVDAPIGRPEMLGYAKDGKSLLVRTNEDHKSVFHEVSLTDGQWGPAIDDPYDELFFDYASHALMGGLDLDGEERRFTFFDPVTAKIWRAIEKAYAGERVSLVSWTADHRRLVVQVDGARDGYGYALVDLDTKHADWIGDIYMNIPVDQITQAQPITYKAADGLEVPAYLTLPAGRDPKGLPLIVMPHGGPAARDYADFDWLREAIVSRGYAVLQPNFRGSSGYTEAFISAGYGQMGRKMQTDLSDGVRYLVGKGMVDPKRVCIFGWSYGGYAALAGATLDQGVYRCAADMAGPSDLRRMLNWVQSQQEYRNNSSLRFWDRYMGASGASDRGLDLISPADQAAKANIPILIVHGKDDTVVPYQQSQVMADALNRAGKPFTLVTLKGEDHWGSRSETRLQLLTAVIDFLEKNNPPQ